MPSPFEMPHTDSTVADRFVIEGGHPIGGEVTPSGNKNEALPLLAASLLAAGGSMTKAASLLGLERSHLYKKMKKLGWRPETWSP